jgi:hypothetical protein
MENRYYPSFAEERAMKVQEFILRDLDGWLKWYQSAEILGIPDLQMRLWKWRYEQWGYDGLLDRRREQPSPKRGSSEVERDVLPCIGNGASTCMSCASMRRRGPNMPACSCPPE